MQKVDRALTLVRASQDERGLHLPSLVPDEAAQLLDEARQEFPELQFWFDFTREWEGALYELTHAERSLFGILMAEALYVRGSGRNGKDNVCNTFKTVGGSYVHSITCSTLCQTSEPYSASPMLCPSGAVVEPSIMGSTRPRRSRSPTHRRARRSSPVACS